MTMDQSLYNSIISHDHDFNEVMIPENYRDNHSITNTTRLAMVSPVELEKSSVSSFSIGRDAGAGAGCGDGGDGCCCCDNDSVGGDGDGCGCCCGDGCGCCDNDSVGGGGGNICRNGHGHCGDGNSDGDDRSVSI